MATKPIENLTAPEQATFRAEIGAENAGAAAAAQAASQPLDSDLTDYANATDAAARRALIGIEEIGTTVPVNAVIASLQITGITNPQFVAEIQFTPRPGDIKVWDSPEGWIILAFESGNPSVAEWKIFGPESSYTASRIRGIEQNPVGLTGWNVTVGAGQPLITAFGTPASPATPTSPFFRVAEGFLYVPENGVWKKVALSNL